MQKNYFEETNSIICKTNIDIEINRVERLSIVSLSSLGTLYYVTLDVCVIHFLAAKLSSII